MAMLRTQIQLTENQMRALKVAARREGLSVAEMVRRLVDQLIENDRRRRALERALEFSRNTPFGSGLSDIAERHDEYLAEGLYEEIQEKRR